MNDTATLPDTQWRCDGCGAEWTMPAAGGNLPECCDAQLEDVRVLYRDGRWLHPSKLAAL